MWFCFLSFGMCGRCFKRLFAFYSGRGIDFVRALHGDLKTHRLKCKDWL